MSNEDLAYIAGFLDGDGCIMMQLVRRKGYALGFQIRASVVFYQKQENRFFLEWLKEKITAGYIRDRNDGMSEYTIVGIDEVQNIVRLLLPFLQLKKPQAELALNVLTRMPASGKGMMTSALLCELAEEVDKFRSLNYSKKRTIDCRSVREYLKTHNLLDPVETDP